MKKKNDLIKTSGLVPPNVFKL